MEIKNDRFAKNDYSLNFYPFSLLRASLCCVTNKQYTIGEIEFLKKVEFFFSSDDNSIRILYLSH